MNRTHGFSIKRNGKRVYQAYNTWANMLSRCETSTSSCFSRYGAKGVTVCARWHSFESFLSDMWHPPDRGYSIEREDNNKGYEPGNCRWIPHAEQSRNKGDNRRITAHGKTMLMQDWARETGLKKTTIFMRLARGWSEHDAVSLSLKHGRHLST